ncbi:LrgB family protein [Desertibacillus haloalkaliphilus]|uniref:LrgB family protein n=1 Tax=Desertibacillus haloalkaliphilus TaxID=1328930 RepID=UPI001C26BF0F|nr:LrgB family protein [Desertibacillus haloalkaliphilus]MBU8905283.1 LrgB family protein [Desertibacillus haloalkaliphilus]
MMEHFMTNTSFSVALTLISYVIGYVLFQKHKRTWLHPLIIGTLMITSILLITDVDFETYLEGTSLFSFLLGTATVSLAIPVYKHLHTLKKHFVVIFSGVILGTVTGMLTVIVFAHLFKLNQEIYISLVPKSVTLPIATSVSATLGGTQSLTTLFVIISALVSLIIGPHLLTKVGIKSKLAKGLALGTSAQALGVSKALQWGEKEGAIGNVAMNTSAVFVAIVVPLIGPYLLL